MGERTDRQQRVLQALQEAVEPMTGTDLAQRCGVTRQVVVHDIAILRAAGEPILSTPRGYMLQSSDTFGLQTVLSVKHEPELTERELHILVDHGLHVMDVIVEHPVYGEMTGSLHLASRRDVDLFMRKIVNAHATLLSSLTEGHHMHTVRYTDSEQLNEAIDALRKAGIHVVE